GDERCADRAFPDNVHSQLLPASSAILGAINPGRTSAGEQNAGINGIDGQGPDRRQVPLGSDMLPPSAAIVANEHTGIASRENGPGLSGMGNQRLYAAVERKRSPVARP